MSGSQVPPDTAWHRPSHDDTEAAIVVGELSVVEVVVVVGAVAVVVVGAVAVVVVGAVAVVVVGAACRPRVLNAFDG
jgi:hypothetical protein